MYSPFQSIEADSSSPRIDHLNKSKQKLSGFENRKSGESRFKTNKKFLNQIKEEADISMITTLIPKISTPNVTKTHFHRRFNSDACSYTQPTEPEPRQVRSKIISQQHLKAELRMSEIKFQKIHKHKKSPEKSFHHEENASTECSSSMSAILSNFNRLRLMANAQGSQRIKKHFYKRSLENCSLDDLKQLLKIEANKKQANQHLESENYVPMKFGKTEALKRGYFTPSQPANLRESEQKKSVWNNEVIRQNFGFNQSTQILNLSHKKSPIYSISCGEVNKIKKFSSKHVFGSEQKENLREKPIVTEMNQRDSQIEANMVYLHKGKRFPINDNKLNGIYQNWQKEHIKKKRIQQLIGNSELNYTCQHRQMKIDSIKFRKIPSEKKKPRKQLTQPLQPSANRLSVQKLQFEDLTEKEVLQKLSQE